ncbi:hypothetical protein LRE75_34260 [Streptomyces sp. 372A]
MTSRTKGRGKNSSTLARRRAALERAAERMAEQRRAAEEAEAERLRREGAFDELVADFELAVQDEAAVAAEVEEEVTRVRERGRVRIDAARMAAARVVLAMGEARETVAGCAQRLGVGVDRVKDLRRLGREGAASEEGEVRAAEKTAAAQGRGGGTGGEQQRGGGRGPGRAGDRSGGAGAPLVTVPGAASVRSAPSGSLAGMPAEASGVAGVGWPESAG